MEVIESVKPKTNTDNQNTSTSCPLCINHSTYLFHQDSQRQYRRCEVCDLTFVPTRFHLSSDEEKSIYDLHQNNPEDQGYRKFLSRLTAPLIPLLSTPSKGLDFGSGPGPTLSLMLTEQGFPTDNYDLYYAYHPEKLLREYDFITSTEVVEHLGDPKGIFSTLFSCLKPQGILAIMTKRTPDSNFDTWHYIKDPTHITFYSAQTFRFIANLYNCKLILPSPDTAILLKH